MIARDALPPRQSMTSGSSSSVLCMTWVVRIGFVTGLVIMTTITNRSIILITVAIIIVVVIQSGAGFIPTAMLQDSMPRNHRVLLIEALVAQQVLFTLPNQALVADILQNHSKHSMRQSPRLLDSSFTLYIPFTVPAPSSCLSNRAQFQTGNLESCNVCFSQK